MEAYVLAPGRITFLVFSSYPRTAGSIQQVLGSQNIGLQEKLGILDAPVYMTFGGEVDNVVESVVGKQPVGQVVVADIASDKDTPFVVDIIGNGTQISCVGQCIQDHYPDIVVFRQHVFQKVGADKAGSSGHKIGSHIR